MTIFRVKGMNGVESYMEILEELDEGCQVHIHSSTPFGERDSEEYISKELLNSCLRTGYLVPVEAKTAS